MIEFRPRIPSSKSSANVGFSIWGALGLFICLFVFATAPSLVSISTSLIWIGGMVLFGFGSIMSEVPYRLVGPSLPVYAVPAPRADGLNENYRGIPYMKIEGGQGIAEFEDGKHTFKNWKKFIASVPN